MKNHSINADDDSLNLPSGTTPMTNRIPLIEETEANKTMDIDLKQDQDDADGFPPQVKRKILIAILFALCVGNMMMQNVASFLPIFVEDQKSTWFTNYGDYVTTTDTSIIIGVFSVA